MNSGVLTFNYLSQTDFASINLGQSFILKEVSSKFKATFNYDHIYIKISTYTAFNIITGDSMTIAPLAPIIPVEYTTKTSIPYENDESVGHDAIPCKCP